MASGALWWPLRCFVTVQQRVKEALPGVEVDSGAQLQTCKLLLNIGFTTRDGVKGRGGWRIFEKLRLQVMQPGQKEPVRWNKNRPTAPSLLSSPFATCLIPPPSPWFYLGEVRLESFTWAPSPGPRRGLLGRPAHLWKIAAVEEAGELCSLSWRGARTSGWKRENAIQNKQGGADARWRAEGWKWFSVLQQNRFGWAQWTKLASPFV